MLFALVPCHRDPPAPGLIADIRGYVDRVVLVDDGSPASTAAELDRLGELENVDLVKHAVDRARPPLADPTLTPLVATPDSPSFPSGHTSTTFAAAAAIGLLHPRLRWPLYAVAAIVGVSRVYLGVHYTLDVLAGAVLGIVVGLFVAWSLRSFPAIATRLRRG